MSTAVCGLHHTATIAHSDQGLTLLCAQLQEGLNNFDSPAAAPSDGPAAAFSGGLEEAVLQNANQFHKWHAELEAACATETEQKYEQFGQLLKGYLASCSALQGKVRLGMRLQLAPSAAAGTCPGHANQQARWAQQKQPLMSVKQQLHLYSAHPACAIHVHTHNDT
jgi:hypothetical protein